MTWNRRLSEALILAAAIGGWTMFKTMGEDNVTGMTIASEAGQAAFAAFLVEMGFAVERLQNARQLRQE